MMEQQVESPEQAEALVNTLQIEGASLSDANLSSLSSSDLEQLADLQAELDSINATEIDSGVDNLEVKPMLDGELVPEIGEQEVVIEADEEPGSPDEILPDCREDGEEEEDGDGEEEEQQLVKFPGVAGVAAAPPPLRPLTIAPKPPPPTHTHHKLPMALKHVVGGGQQIVLIQSPGGTTNTVNLGGQQIKLLSSQGQTVSIPNLQNMQKNIVQLRAVPKPGPGEAGTIQGLQTIKKIIPQPKQVKVLGPNTGDSLVTTKTITLAQAQQMGLVQKITPQSPTKIVMNKPIQAKTIKVMPQVKSPTKILPAPVQLQKIQTKEGMQRVIIKQGTQLKTVNTTSAGPVNQVIRLPAGQSPGQIHQIQVPGKGVQYIRFMTSSAAGTGSTATLSTAGAGAKASQKAQVVPVAGITVNRTKVVTTTQQQQHNQIIKVGDKGLSYKVVPLSTGQTRPVAPKPTITGQRLIIPATSSQVKPTQTIATIPAAALSQIQNAIMPSGNNVSQIVMLPAQYMQQLQNSTPKLAVTAKSHPPKPSLKSSPVQAKDSVPPPSLTPSAPSAHDPAATSPDSGGYASARPLEPNGIRPRKPCNCTKSLCLKLYCDCFANGEFCHLCNCMNCYNNLDKEEERQRAIRNCLERNPNAFRPKIGKGKDSGESSVRKHTKGCNCKRSGCLKNYCECYEAKIACSSNCKCVGCRNIEDSMEKKNVRPLAPMPDNQLQVVPTANKQERDSLTSFRPMLAMANKLPSTYMTGEVIEATNQCMIAQADEAERNMLGEELGARLILEEFGRCLVQIIECSSQATTTTNT